LEANGRNIDIDDLFRQKLEDFSPEPGSAVKANLMRRVSGREFLRFNPARFNVWYLAASVIAATFVLSVALNSGPASEGNDNSIFVSDSTVDTNSGHNSGDYDVASDSTGTDAGTDSHVVINVDRPLVESVRKRTTTKEKATDTTAIRQVQSSTFKPDKDYRVATAEDRITIISQPVSSFTVSSLEGCAPLSVSLQSTSLNYKTLKWRSSDGKMSVEGNPDWTFTQPGVYTVILSVADSEGRESHSSAEITVHNGPVARFDALMAGGSTDQKEIIIYNYSEGYTSSFWNFGDGSISELNEPVHTFNSAGLYRIHLKVTNEKGCTDTISEIYKAGRGAFNIEFPNAFIPNRNGPTGGYYSLRSDEAIQVFHPEFEGVSEYHLVIYTRAGMVLFESRDLNIGWDGYYKGQLCEPGVYVWRARGQFTSGEQFVRAGDVTLLKGR
jgi:PKD repeat protein